MKSQSLERYLDQYGHTIDWPENREDETYQLVFEAISNIECPLPHSPAFMRPPSENPRMVRTVNE
ncbi:hypothetical protein GCM10008019_43030 [Deinococcus soli (ex Cha et al. 2016)]|nr:hypothetical protein GCM10008019_43030 [Deinococcus soli (ex Cha et al. 2016)]